jgi:uncharacterized protein
MTYSPTVWDFALLAALLASFAVSPFVAARIKAAIESGRHPRARLRLYYFNIVRTWGFTLAVFTLWIAFGRPWTDLWLGVPHFWRFAAGLLLAAVYIWDLLRTRRRFLAKPETFARYRKVFASFSLVAAQTPQERRLFPFLAVTAGIGEEVLLRGFVFSLFASMFGLWIGALINIVIFGLVHAYQGWAGIVRTGAFAIVVTVIVVASGSLVPAILIHAFQDLIGGDIVSRAFLVPPNGHRTDDVGTGRTPVSL